MLHSITRERTLRTLLAQPRRSWSLVELAREAESARSRVSREVKQLVQAGHLHPKTFTLLRPLDTMEFFALGWQVAAVPVRAFAAIERAEAWIEKLSEIARKGKLRIAFTGLAGAEMISPYVVPATVLAYVSEEEAGSWEKALLTAGAYPAEDARAARLLLLMWDHADHRAVEIRGNRLVSVPQMYADLRSRGGIEVQAAAKLLEGWNVRSA